MSLSRKFWSTTITHVAAITEVSPCLSMADQDGDSYTALSVQFWANRTGTQTLAAALTVEVSNDERVRADIANHRYGVLTGADAELAFWSTTTAVVLSPGADAAITTALGIVDGDEGVSWMHIPLLAVGWARIKAVSSAGSGSLEAWECRSRG